MDREGNLLLDGLVGGTPVLSMNGNRWVGTGHGDVFKDFAGQLWLVYEAVDQTDPYFIQVNPDGSVTVEMTKRPALIDRLEWVDGWPSVRAGFWASQEPQLAPAARPTHVRGALPLIPFPSWIDQPSQTLAFDDFRGSQLKPDWIKLDRDSIRETRQTEYAKEIKPVPPGYARYGNTVVGPPGEATWLRIVRREWNGLELYTAYTSQDGTHWVRGGTWDHQLQTQARLGLVAMGGIGFTAEFDYVRISRPLLNVPPGESSGVAP